MVGYDFIKGMYLNLLGCMSYASVKAGDKVRRPGWELSEPGKFDRFLGVEKGQEDPTLSEFLMTCYNKKGLKLDEGEDALLAEIGVLGYICGRNVAYSTVKVGELKVLPGNNRVVFNGFAYPMWPGKKDDVSNVEVPENLPLVARQVALDNAVPILLDPGSYDEIEFGDSQYIFKGRHITGQDGTTYQLQADIAKGTFSVDLTFAGGGKIQLFNFSGKNLPKTNPFSRLERGWENYKELKKQSQVEEILEELNPRV